MNEVEDTKSTGNPVLKDDNNNSTNGSSSNTTKDDVENQAQTELPKPLQPNGYTAPAAYANTGEWEKDRREIAKVKHDGLNGFLKASIYERVSLLRDTLGISITILVGSFTVYFTLGSTTNIIKTPGLFFASIIILIVGVVANLLARAEIIKHLQSVSYQIEKNYIDLYNASREVMKNHSQYNLDTAYRIEGSSPPFPLLNRRGNYGHSISLWSIVIAALLLTISLIFKVSV